MKRERGPGDGNQHDNLQVEAAIALRPLGTKKGEGGSIKIIMEPTTVFASTPGAGEATLRAGVAGLEEVARSVGEDIEIVLSRQPGRVFGFSKRDPRSRYLCPELFPEIPAADSSSMD